MMIDWGKLSEKRWKDSKWEKKASDCCTAENIVRDLHGQEPIKLKDFIKQVSKTSPPKPEPSEAEESAALFVANCNHPPFEPQSSRFLDHIK